MHSSEEVPAARLLSLLSALSAHVAALSTQKPYKTAPLLEALAPLDAASRAHWAAVEAVPMAALRQHYSREESKWSLEKHVVEDEGKAQDVGWLLVRCFANDAARDSWLHRVPEISVEKRKSLCIPEAHAYERDTQRLIVELIKGAHGAPVVDPAGGCCIVS